MGAFEVHADTKIHSITTQTACINTIKVEDLAKDLYDDDYYIRYGEPKLEKVQFSNDNVGD